MRPKRQMEVRHGPKPFNWKPWNIVYPAGHDYKQADKSIEYRHIPTYDHGHT